VGDKSKFHRTVCDLLGISGWRPCAVSFAFVGLTMMLCSLAAYPQDPGDIAPPPIKMLSKSEKADLTAKTEPKQRTTLALDLMNRRLSSAEKFRTDENYSLMYAELGGFHALMDDTIQFLLKANTREGKQLNSLKKFEIGLRSYVPRLEAVRRDLPSNFDPYLKALLKNIDETREKAMAPFFSNTVISNSQQ
jgi:hypothetical protein